MYQIQNLDSSIASLYEKFTFPRFRHLLQQKHHNSIVAGTASYLGKPAGLILAEAIDGGKTGIIHSLFVAPHFRNLGFGRELLHFSEEKLREKGCKELEMKFNDSGNSSEAIKNILGKCGWGEPVLMSEYNKFDCFTLAKEGWLYRHPLPASYTVTAWKDVSPAKLEDLKGSVNKCFPSYASPFQKLLISPHLPTSFWLCRREEIVGWVITGQSAPDTLYYHTLFVREDLQGTGRGAQFFAEALKTHFREGIPFGNYVLLHTAGYSNKPLIRFLEKRIKPFALKTEKHWSVYK